MPEALIRELEIEAGARDEEILWETIRKVYDIEKDDFSLRKITGLKEEERGPYFDSLRKEYPIRREFSNTTLKINRGSKNIINKFQYLKFLT